MNYIQTKQWLQKPKKLFDSCNLTITSFSSKKPYPNFFYFHLPIDIKYTNDTYIWKIIDHPSPTPI